MLPMPTTPVRFHPGGSGTRGKRCMVVRATTSPEEQAFFLEMQRQLCAPSMADLIRHCCVRIAQQENLEIELPERWKPLYETE